MNDTRTNGPPPDQLSLFDVCPVSFDHLQNKQAKKSAKAHKVTSQPRNKDVEFDPDFDELPQEAEDHLVNAYLATIDLPNIITDDELNRIAIGCLSHFWDNVVMIITARLRRKNKKLSREFQLDYEATLGWLLGYWEGSIPLDMVLLYENNLQSDVYNGDSLTSIKHLLHTHPVLSHDCEQLRIKLCGGGLFMKEAHVQIHPSDIGDPLSLNECDGRH